MSNLSDEDDEFLYGETEISANPLLDTKNDVDDLYDLYEDNDTKDTEVKEEDTKQDQDMGEVVKQEQDTTIAEAEDEVEVGGDEVKEEENQEEEEDSEDDLEIILEAEEEVPQETETEPTQGETTAATDSNDNAPVNIKPGQQGKTSSSTPADNTTSTTSGTKTGGINLELVGEYNGTAITEVDLDNAEDKPWRKPGADITDYFNYGFNEVSWRSYCAKQKMLRENKKMMGDMDMGDFMSMGMMMPPPNMMDGMPMMPGMPNPMMVMGMPQQNNAMRNNINRPPGQFNRQDKRPNKDGKEGDMEMEDGNNQQMFPMDFPPGAGMPPMNMFPPDMPGGPMGMPFFNPNMPPMGFDPQFRPNNNNSNNRAPPPMRSGMNSGGRSQIFRDGHNNPSQERSSSSNPSSSWRGRDDSPHRSSDSRKRGDRSDRDRSDRDKESRSDRDRDRSDRDRDSRSDRDRDSSSHDDHYNKRSRNR